MLTLTTLPEYPSNNFALVSSPMIVTISFALVRKAITAGRNSQSSTCPL